MKASVHLQRRARQLGTSLIETLLERLAREAPPGAAELAGQGRRTLARRCVGLRARGGENGS